MNILIAGSDLNAVLLAQYLKRQNEQNDIYVTTNVPHENGEYIPINIKENDIASICDFIKYNQIEFTIATSPIAIINGIADVLHKEGFSIFAPFSESARITYLTSVAKKIMYKLKINTPKFGIFDRENLAFDYIRKSKYPLVIQNDLTIISRESEVFDTFLKAKKGIQKLFENGNDKIIIENYIDSRPIYIYFITDGYNAYPLIALERTEENGFTKIIAPSEKVSFNTISTILNKVIYPLLDDIKQYSNSYIGIIGLKTKFVNNNFYILELYNGFQSYDFQAFLSIFNDDLLSLMIEAGNSSLPDRNLDFFDDFSYTLAINKKNIILDNFEEDTELLESEDKQNYIFTSTASTLNRAKTYLYNEIQDKCSEKFFNSLINDDEQKEVRI